MKQRLVQFNNRRAVHEPRFEMTSDEAAEFGEATASATVEERELLKAMSWWDGFMVALANPGFLVAALGGSIAGLGTLGATVLWTISVALGLFQNSIYAELATMFPLKSGGIGLFAHEAWRKYFSPIGPLATFGYWFAWSTVLSISGLIAGTLLYTQFLPGASFSLTGFHFHLDLPVLIGIVFVCLVWFFGARGIRASVWFSYVTGILLLIPLFVMMFLPYATGTWHASNMQWNIGSGGAGFALAVTWLYFMAWSSYGFESVAAFAPEYRDTRADTPRALYSSAVFSLILYILLPLGVGGTLGTKPVANDPTGIAFYTQALDAIGGHLIGSILVICMICGIVLTMETATMDGSRALYGIAKDGMTIKWLG
ncbi:MAG: APC family permease, partial [Streptosporangiales bacterium]